MIASAVLIGPVVLAQPIVAQSRFDSTSEGWVVNWFLDTQLCNPLGTGSGTLSSNRLAVGGNPGGFLRHGEPGGFGVSYFRGPASFRGDLSAAFGGVLSLDQRINGAPNTTSEELQLQGAGRSLVTSLPVPGRDSWKRLRVRLAPGAWRVNSCTGPLATEAEIKETLANVTGLLFRAEHVSGVENDDLDNVILAGPASVPTSTFDSDIEGWAIINDATLSWDAASGVPAGCLKAVDQRQGLGYAFKAPAKFLGNQLAAVGKTLEIDFRADPASDFVPNVGFVFFSNGQKSLEYHEPSPIAGNVWRYHAIPITPSPAWRRSSDRLPATQSDFEEVFSTLTSFTIRGEYRDGGETEWVDNVVLGSCVPSAVITSPDVSVCARTSVTLASAAGGGGPYTYSWRARNVLLSNGGRISGADGPVLSVADATAADAGSYECVVSTVCGVVVSNVITLRVCASDLNCDGQVDDQDFSIFSVAYDILECSSPAMGSNCPADLDRDGAVDDADFGLFLMAYDRLLCP